ncbi:ERCC4 domain-containing protein [Xylariaceae sp. FL1019]|nr:ERCC4 domain-containing protein [Xylariaceae sp. FL1019]
MPEVINLLSSSPEPVTKPFSKTSRSETSPEPGTALDCGPRPTKAPPVDATSSHASKRGFDHKSRRNTNDFLFLSDDFDTTGDLDVIVQKKPRTSLGPSQRTKKPDSPSSKNTKSATASSNPREPLRAAQPKRWNSLVDDIEWSSSPVEPDPTKVSSKAKEAPPVTSDPFASSPSHQLPAHIPRKTDTKHIGGSESWSWPAEISQTSGPSGKNRPDVQDSSKSTDIEILSDPFDSSPREKPPPKPDIPRTKAVWDPISSSAPEPRESEALTSHVSTARKHKTTTEVVDLEMSDSSDSDELPDLADMDAAKIRSLSRSQSYSTTTKHQSSKSATKKPVKATTKIAKTAEEKDREKKQREALREVEKERKRVEKEQAKQERAVQKEKDKAMTEVNKLRTDKKVSTPEMIVDIPASLEAGVKVQIETLLSDLDVQYNTWDSTVENVVKWRRKVTSRFNEELGFWEPVPLRIENVNHTMVVIQASEFVELALADEGSDLEAHVLKMKTKFPKTKLIYLIEGLMPWMRKNKNLLNRQFASAVRGVGAGSAQAPASSQPRRRNKSQHQEYIDEDKIEDALLSLQVMHGTLVHHTNAPVETAQWVAVFTQHISTIPYRHARDAASDAGFCMESGQVRTGDGAKDTYIHMLQEIARVTAPIAYGIATKYESVPELVQGLEQDGPLALENCRKSANKDGALTDRCVGPSISKRIHKIFLGRDPASTDV